jgi:BR serine/threonine kinase
VTEYGGHGDLFEYLRARKSLQPAQAMHFFRQLIEGLEYLHGCSICHRDLKPENLYLDSHDDLKIGDFGLARSCADGLFESACGSIQYLAPEAFSGDPYDGRKADIWSCGVILFLLLSGRLPFVDPCESALAAKIRAGRLYAPGLSPEIRELVSKILNVNVKVRYSIAQIKAHPAFQIGVVKESKVPRSRSQPLAYARVPDKERRIGVSRSANDGAPDPYV